MAKVSSSASRDVFYTVFLNSKQGKVVISIPATSLHLYSGFFSSAQS